MSKEFICASGSVFPKHPHAVIKNLKVKKPRSFYFVKEDEADKAILYLKKHANTKGIQIKVEKSKVMDTSVLVTILRTI